MSFKTHSIYLCFSPHTHICVCWYVRVCVYIYIYIYTRIMYMYRHAGSKHWCLEGAHLHLLPGGSPPPVAMQLLSSFACCNPEPKPFPSCSRCLLGFARASPRHRTNEVNWRQPAGDGKCCEFLFVNNKNKRCRFGRLSGFRVYGLNGFRFGVQVFVLLHGWTRGAPVSYLRVLWSAV